MTTPSGGETGWRRPAGTTVLAWLVGAATFAIFTPGFGPLNDHYGRMSPARQIARYGEHPFRDYFDPGYYLTEYSSAVMLWLFGDSLMGEWLLTVSFIAVGTALVFVMAARIGRSRTVGVVATALSVLAMPRLYDYDKSLFYPLGLLLCWCYLDRRSPRAILLLAFGTVMAAGYRYDSGVYIAAAALAAMLTMGHGRALAIRDGGRYLLSVAILATPAAVLVHLNGGLANAIDQVLTYGPRESARTRLSDWPAVSLGPLVARVGQADSPGLPIQVRWAPGLDDTARRELERSFGLPPGTTADPASRTYTYRVARIATPEMSRLVNHPQVEDTHGFDRATLAAPERAWLKRVTDPIRRWRILPSLDDYDTASALLFYLLLALPLCAALLLLRSHPSERPYLASAIVMCVLLDVFILRDPVAARVGGMAGPFAVLGAWLFRQFHAAVTRARESSAVWGRLVWPAALGLVAMFVISTVRVLAATTQGTTHVWNAVLALPSFPSAVRVIGTDPPPLDRLPNSHMEPLIHYLRACTEPDDRIYTTWFVPEVFFFAQRPFAGGMVVTFGRHWSEPRFQQRIVEKLRTERVPLVVAQPGGYDDVQQTYPLVGRYLEERFSLAGQIGQPPEVMQIFAARDRRPVRTHPEFNLPCFR